MSGSSDWVFVLLFFVVFLAAMIGEIYWLNSRAGVEIRRAMILVFSSSFVAITIGFFVSFIILGVIFAVAWDENTEMPGGEAGTWMALAIAVLFPVLLLAGLKRLLILLLRLDKIGRPFLYSIGTSVGFFLAVIGFPALFIYLF